MEGPERVVCCTLCMCMAVAVFSSVALVYLTALVYMPAKREINSGLSDVPVMCTTVATVETDNCDWYSCGEWCLSKSSHCVKLWAQVRKNGSDIRIEGCTNVQDVTCMVLDDDFVSETPCQHDADCESLNDRFFDKCGPYDCGQTTRPFACDVKARRCVSVRQYRNCKNDDTCTNLNSFFLCENGLCQNITSVFDCQYDKALPPVNCKDKRNCITLTGLFHCKRGQCSQLQWPWHCDRRCNPVATDRSRNVLLLSGDRMVAASCDAAIRTAHLGQRSDVRQLGVQYEAADSLFRGASDCLNGTLMPRELLPSDSANYTLIHRLFAEFGWKFPLDEHGDRELSSPTALTRMERIPFDKDIVIYNRTKLLINTEGCVNTLSYECTQFYLDHRRDGRNYSARDRYPCFYTPRHGNFVTTRFSVANTQYVFLMAFAIPASLWVVSCSCLFGCSKVLRVEESTGQMQVRCRRKLKRRSSLEDINDLEADTEPEVEEVKLMLAGAGEEAIPLKRKEQGRRHKSRGSRDLDL